MEDSSKKINLYLLGYKGLMALKRLEAENLKNIDNVIVGRDWGVENDYSEDIKEISKQMGLRCYSRKDWILGKIDTNYAVAIGWKWIIHSRNIIVFHDSILPKYRGFNPLVTALLNEDKEIGVSVLVGKDDYDTGDIILQKTILVEYPIKIENAISLISSLYSSALNELIVKITSNNLQFTPQNDTLATYSLWRDENDYWIDWNESAEYIKRFIDTVGFPYLGAKTTLDGKVLRIYDSEVSSKSILIANKTPGKVVFKNNENYYIVCGKGVLIVSSFFDEGNKEVILSNFRLRFKSNI